MPGFSSASRAVDPRRNHHRARPRHAPRTSLPSDVRDHRGAHSYQSDTYVPRTSRGLERALARYLQDECDDFDIQVDYEPVEFETDLTGEVKTGKRHIRPDFHLRNFWAGLDLYIEATQGNELVVASKRSKARGAMRIARNRGHDLVILVFDRQIIEQLVAGSLDLVTAVEKGLAELGQLVPATSIH